MQDRVEMYNTVMALEEEQDSTLEETKVAPGTRVRKTSKVMFEPPEIEVAQDGKVTAEVHQVRKATEIFSKIKKYFLDLTSSNKSQKSVQGVTFRLCARRIRSPVTSQIPNIE